MKNGEECIDIKEFPSLGNSASGADIEAEVEVIHQLEISKENAGF